MPATVSNNRPSRARTRAGGKNLARRSNRKVRSPRVVSTHCKRSETRHETRQRLCQGSTEYHRGQQYSVIALTNGSGTITERYAYAAYGTPTITDASGTARTTSADNNRYTYTGREWDEVLGLYHYRARMYDSVAGRFCSRDPIGFGDGFNVYRIGITLHRVDPTGNCTKTLCSVTVHSQGRGYPPGKKPEKGEKDYRDSPLYTPRPKRNSQWPIVVNSTGDCPNATDGVSIEKMVDRAIGRGPGAHGAAVMLPELDRSECSRLGLNDNDEKCECGDCVVDRYSRVVKGQFVQDKLLTTNLTFTFHWETVGGLPGFEDSGQLETSEKPIAGGRGPCTVTFSGEFPVTIVKTTLEGKCVENLNSDDLQLAPPE